MCEAFVQENRRAYREIFITADGISGHLSGIILNSETLEQKTAAGKPFLDVLTSSGIYAGIKVDQVNKQSHPLFAKLGCKLAYFCTKWKLFTGSCSFGWVSWRELHFRIGELAKQLQAVCEVLLCGLVESKSAVRV